MASKIDSNVVGLSIAEEETLKVLPASPVWYEQEPNSFSDFGGELKTVARNPINQSRQRKKGSVVDLDASGGFNQDFTQNNFPRLFQGFVFADAREKFSTKPFNGTAIAITNVDATGVDFEAASGLDGFKAGDLVKASGFANSANNGLKLVSAAAAASLTVSSAIVDEVPTSEAKLECVGFQFASGELSFTVSASSIVLASTTTDFTTLGLVPGEWVFIGGDAATNTFANNVGYARIYSISENEILFDDVTWSAVTEAGTGKSIRMFFGMVIKNEKTPSLIKTRSYQIERTLGEDADGVQSEYLEGAIANELTFNIPEAEKLNIDLSFIALDNTQRDGATGVKSGTRVSALGEDAYNSSNDIYRLRLAVYDASDLMNSSLFAYVNEANFSIKNNCSPNKAISVLGAFGVSVGTFEVDASVTAYFSTVASVAAVRNNADVGFSIIGAKNNAGFVFDMPLLSLSGGRLNVEQDQPIKIPLEQAAAECQHGYTLLTTFLPYVPNVGMP